MFYSQFTVYYYSKTLLSICTCSAEGNSFCNSICSPKQTNFSVLVFSHHWNIFCERSEQSSQLWVGFNYSNSNT